MQGVFSQWYKDTYNLEISASEMTFLWAVTVSIYIFGGMISAAIAGALADKFGRAACQLSEKLTFLFDKYMIVLYETGLITVATPLYLNEISPPQLRGKVGTVHPIMLMVALSLSQVLGLPQILGTNTRFYYLLALPVVTGVLHWLMFAFCPESPSWLYLFKKDREAARAAIVYCAIFLIAALEKLRDMDVMSAVDLELAEYHKQEIQSSSVSWVCCFVV
ncbi:Glut1 [Bugula neritina]|uniref:Glut1 n=1 Tax=Bugula neritina TaxID=10212 RepID=A0A7J7J6F5_BUGNE|nr:Glut1 [Bugula neritina]